MATTYEFQVVYSKDGIATAPANAPTILVVDKDNNILVAALTAVTAIANMPGAYYYAYTGADNLTCYGLFHTADTTVDKQDLSSYTASQIYTNQKKIDVIDGIVDAILLDTGTDGVLIADDAITSAAFDEATAFPVTSVDAGATEIARTGADGDTLETLSDEIADTEPADIWSYASRTLTQSAASVASAVAGDDISVNRGDTISISLTDIGSLANNSKIYFTVKNSESDPDTAAIIMIEKTDGLKYINGAVGTPANGSLVVDDEATGDITITLAAVEAAKLVCGADHWDVQILRTVGVPISTLVAGTFIVSSDITRAVT